MAVAWPVPGIGPLVPAPLTIQWQDELLRFFDEPFQIIHSANDQQQLLNLWERETQVVSSIDYAKQDGVRERVWQQRWDLIIIDEADKCSAYTKRSMVSALRTARRPSVNSTAASAQAYAPCSVASVSFAQAPRARASDSCHSTIASDRVPFQSRLKTVGER